MNIHIKYLIHDSDMKIYRRHFDGINRIDQGFDTRFDHYYSESEGMKDDCRIKRMIFKKLANENKNDN